MHHEEIQRELIRQMGGEPVSRFRSVQHSNEFDSAPESFRQTELQLSQMRGFRSVEAELGLRNISTTNPRTGETSIHYDPKFYR